MWPYSWQQKHCLSRHDRSYRTQSWWVAFSTSPSRMARLAWYFVVNSTMREEVVFLLPSLVSHPMYVIFAPSCSPAFSVSIFSIALCWLSVLIESLPVATPWTITPYVGLITHAVVPRTLTQSSSVLFRVCLCRGCSMEYHVPTLQLFCCNDSGGFPK